MSRRGVFLALTLCAACRCGGGPSDSELGAPGQRTVGATAPTPPPKRADGLDLPLGLDVPADGGVEVAPDAAPLPPDFQSVKDVFNGRMPPPREVPSAPSGPSGPGAPTP